MDAGKFIKPEFIVRDCGKAFDDVVDRDAELYSLSTKLTPEEAASKYAKYYNMGPAEPSKENLLAIERGAQIDPSKAFMMEDYAKLMNAPGHREIETGYCIMPNGVGFVAGRVFQMGMTDEKMQFFVDHYNPEGDLFYKTWYPGAHMRHYSDMAVEDLGWGMEEFRFVHPFTMEEINVPEEINKNDPQCISVNGFNILSYPLHHPDAEPMHLVEMTYDREIPGGREKRVNFWIGTHFENGHSKLYLPDNKPVEMNIARAQCAHVVWEFTTLTRNILTFWDDAHNGYFEF